MPAVTVLNPVVDEEPDTDLDLHVSDTEDVDDPEPVDKDRSLDDIPMEVEDEILSKFEGSEEEKDESSKPAPPPCEDEKSESKVESNDEPIDNIKIEKEDVSCELRNEEESNSKEKETSDSPELKLEEETVTAQEKDGENEDLLTVMEEKTAEADENEGDFLDDTTEGEIGEDNVDKDKSDTNNDTESNSEDTDIASTQEEIASPPAEIQAEDGDDNTEGDGEMDIEECGLDTTITTHDAVETPDGLNITVKSDENKENEGSNASDEDGKSVLETILTATKTSNQKPSETTGTKRLMSDPPPKEEPSKKQKLIDEIKGKLEGSPQESEDIPMKRLGSFSNFMFEKTVKILTREELEMFCMEKMCECIVQKSEIGDLKMKIKMHEQLLDCLRKETVLLSKQTKDLNIVHQKVKQDVAKIKENSDKQLIVPKITRSVGLQAVVRDDRRKQTGNTVPGQVVTKFIAPITTANTVNRTPVKSPRTPTPTTKPVQSPRFTPPVKTNVQSPTIRTVQAVKKTAIVSANTPNGTGKGGVIDLTDEDDKKTSTPTNNTATTVAASNGAITTTSSKTSSITTPNGTKFQPLISPAAGQKLVVVSNGQAMIMKIAPNNVLTTAPNRTVQANGVRMTSQGLRGTAPGVRAVFAANRTRGPAPGTVRARAQLQPKSNRHPAPLPGPPPLKPDVHSLKPLPPKPQLMLNKTPCGTGIVLSWKMPYDLDRFEMIASYQLYAYQETKSEPKTENWGKIGDVKALELPMAVTLTQFAVGNRYYFAVRAVDVLTRHGAFSEYQTILL